MTGDVRFVELTTVKDGLLDSRVAHSDGINGALQSQWELIRDGLSQGAKARTQQAVDNSLLTGVEIAGSVGLGAGMSLAMKAGGRWAKAAEIAAVGFTGLMGLDLSRRGAAIHEAYSRSDGSTQLGQAMRRDAIAQYAGAGLVDYSMMFASGALGAGAVHFAPKLNGKLSTALEPLGNFGEPRLQPALAANSRFSLMDLGESGRFGAKELPKASLDSVSAARQRLEFPHRSVGLDQLSALMEAKQIAAHPEVRPIYEQMADTLGKVDTLKPKLLQEEQSLASLDRQLNDVKALKAENKLIRDTETTMKAIEAESQKLPAMKQEHNSLGEQIKDAGKAKKSGDEAAAEATAARKAKEEKVDVDALRERRRDLSQSITYTEARAAQLPELQSKLFDAISARATREAAIKAGTDAEALAIESQMAPLKESIASRKTELAALTEQLRTLDQQYQSKADQVRPSLSDSNSAVSSDVPKYTKPKAPEAPRPVRQQPVEATMPAPPAESRVSQPEVKAPAELPKAEAKAPEPKVEAKVEPKVEPKAAEAKPEQNRVQPERVESRTPERRFEAAPKVSEADVTKALAEAKAATEDFAATHKRHTTALKKVNEYIEKAFGWFASDAKASNNAGAVAQNVDQMLAKLENWDRAPGWLRPQDKAQIMRGNGFDAVTMDKFDAWYKTQNQNFNGGNMMADRRLVEIQQHLSRRVAVESVKNWLRTSADVKSAVSPIVNEGFEIMASGKLPDGKPIPKGSDMVVFEKRRGADGKETVLPFAKDGQHMQRFDDAKISEGLRKLQTMTEQGPQGLKPEDLYGFRLDHDPSRLMASREQVGFAILRPGGAYGKNIMYMQIANSVEATLIPKALRIDSPAGPGTNTGVLYNMLRLASGGAKPKG
ncbi:MAG: hypothetical protein K2X27_05785 [Candidatus Obscuribacterales bacterium]|nr:hypothetical protein [Candidatus Obscuribacterales bacterium]